MGTNLKLVSFVGLCVSTFDFCHIVQDLQMGTKCVPHPLKMCVFAWSSITPSQPKKVLMYFSVHYIHNHHHFHVPHSLSAITHSHGHTIPSSLCIIGF